MTLVQKYLKSNKRNINAEERRIRNVANSINGQDVVHFSTLFAYSNGFLQLSERLDNFKNVIINKLE